MREPRYVRILNITGLILLVVASGLAFLFWQKSNRAETEHNRQGADMQGLELEKSMIERELDSLTISYRDARLENEDLRGKAATSMELIATKDAAIRNIKIQERRTLDALLKQVEELRRIKIEYETIIATVRGENEHLRATNQQLAGENTQLRDENDHLNSKMARLAKQLEEEIRKTRSAHFNASSFRVEVIRKTDRLTVRAKEAREIHVSFDLVEVPESYWGVQQLYLAIVDEKGRPISAQNPLKTTVQAPSGPVAVIAQQVKPIALKATQRLSFSYKIDERLPAGNYVVAIYCESGLLGAASFRVM